MMGKRMRELMAARRAENGERPGLRNAIKGKLEEVMKVDDLRNNAAMRTRADPRMQERWMAYSNADSPEGIDYANPCVYIEWSACDPAVYGMADDPDLFCEETKCDRDVYMKHYWPGVPGA